MLASVPGRFLLAGTGPAEVVVVSGDRPDWPAAVAAAVRDGATGVLLAQPGLADPEEVRRLSAAVAGHAAVAVDTRYANDRTWQSALGDVGGDAGTASILDCVVSVQGEGSAGALAGALLDQLAVVRPLLGPLDELRPVYRRGRGYVLVAQTPGPRVTLTGISSAVGGGALALDVVAPAYRWQVRFHDAALARPTEVTRYDETGAHTRALVYESGRRATWLRLHEALRGHGEVGYRLDDLADDLALARRVLR